MEDLGEKKEERNDGSEKTSCEGEHFSEFGGKHPGSHSNSEASSSRSSSCDDSRNESHVSSEEASKEVSELLSWPIMNNSVSSSGNSKKISQDDDNADKVKRCPSEVEMMKERFAKLLLGEDMSGCGKGVCTAMAISNAITNLCVTVFGQLWRLEPLSDEKKSMWRREMEWLICLSDHIVEFKPSWQTFHDGSKLEVMSCRPRSDLYINLPALRKLDNMLIDVLDSFRDPEFWYIDKVILPQGVDVSSSFRRSTRHQEKWWLPSPHVPPGGICEKTRKQMEYKRECTNQILKAALSINSNALTEMEVPEPYIDSLPKHGRLILGNVMYRCITSEQFSSENLLDFLDLSTEHQALNIANRLEAASFIWNRRSVAKAPRNSWGMVKEFMLVDGDKRELLADRADNLLLCLKQRFSGLTQTTLDTSKIQFNKDVGKSIIEAYSRVLESLAFNIIARIDDLLYVDDLEKNRDQFSSVPAVSLIAHKKPSINRASYTRIISLSGTPLMSTARSGERKSHGFGFGLKKVLADYLSVDLKDKRNSNVVEVSAPKQRLNK